MAVTTTKTNKPINPRGNDQSPKGYNRASLFSGKALDFDGVNDYVDLDGFTLSGTTATFVFNFNTDILDDFRYLFDISNNRFIIGFGSTSGVIQLYDGAFKNIFTPTIGEWYNLAVSVDGTNANCYVNGVLETTLSIAAINLSSATQSSIGANRDKSGKKWQGYISGARIFNTALTAAQVADLYNNPEKIVPTGVADSALKLWLPMMEGAGTTAYDGSGNGNHGTISGATYVNGVGAPVAQSAVIDWNKGVNRSEYSEDLSQSAWAKTNISVSASATTAPDGSTNAWNAVPDTSNNIHLVQDGGYSVSSGNYYVASGWFKANGYDYALISYSGYGNWGGSNGAEVKFDLVNGTATPTGGAPHGYGIVEYPNGWYRCYTIGLANSTFSTNVNFFASDDGTSGSFVGDGTSGVLMWGLHSFISSEIGPYIPTLSTAQTSPVLLPQGLTTGRDITGVNLFENVRKQGALNLDGNSWAEVHDNASVDLTDGITVEAWVYWGDTAASQGILSKWGAVDADKSYLLQARSNDKVRFYIYDSANYQVESSTLTDGWNHICANYDGSTLRLYVNGSADGTTSHTGSAQTVAYEVEIGRYGSSTATQYANDIAQPRIYNRALTAEEVARNYTAGKYTYTND